MVYSATVGMPSSAVNAGHTVGRWWLEPDEAAHVKPLILSCNGSVQQH